MMGRAAPSEANNIGVLWVALGIGLCSVAACFALALYHSPLGAEEDENVPSSVVTSVEG